MLPGVAQARPPGIGGEAVPQGHQTGEYPPTLQPRVTRRLRGCGGVRSWAGTARHCPAFGNACTCQNPWSARSRGRLGRIRAGSTRPSLPSRERRQGYFSLRQAVLYTGCLPTSSSFAEKFTTRSCRSVSPDRGRSCAQIFAASHIANRAIMPYFIKMPCAFWGDGPISHCLPQDVSGVEGCAPPTARSIYVRFSFQKNFRQQE